MSKLSEISTFFSMLQVSPDNDVYGSYGLSPGMKRYNHSCSEYDSLGEPAADPFLRICPLGVKSCFYITGKYGDQSIHFFLNKFIILKHLKLFLITH